MQNQWHTYKSKALCAAREEVVVVVEEEGAEQTIGAFGWVPYEDHHSYIVVAIKS